MKRQIESSLIRWAKSPIRKPLILRGARQVGKTFSIQEFGKSHFQKFIAFDFQQQKSIHRIFDGDLTISTILLQLEASCGTRITPGDTLVFFDEIQECPRALLSLRYFNEQHPSLHIIAAGSLLEFAMGDASFPVGRVDFEWMYPMNFAEFLTGTGQELLREHIPDIANSKKTPSFIHQKLLEQLRLYCVVGGMPEAVAAFVSSGSLSEVSNVHRRLASAFRQDIPRLHRRVDVSLVEYLFDQLPRCVGTQIKYSSLIRETRIEKIKTALRILEQGLLVHKVYENTAMGLPLGAAVSEQRFKFVFLDIGLMQHLCGIPAVEILHANSIINVFRGALAEQLIGQQLLSTGLGSENGKLYYWIRQVKSSTAEVDYVIVRNGTIHPVEVKSGASGTLKSLSIFIKEHPSAGYGIVLGTAECSVEPKYKLMRLPLYTDLK